MSSDPAPATPARIPGAWPLAGGLIAGTVADALLGDPRRGHPVALFGAAVQLLEDCLYAPSRARGAILTACGLALAAGPAIGASMTLPGPAGGPACPHDRLHLDRHRAAVAGAGG